MGAERLDGLLLRLRHVTPRHAAICPFARVSFRPSRAVRFNCARAESRAAASVWQLPHDGTAASSPAKHTRRALLDTLDSADVDT
jgi:hypothetical protein